MPGETTGKKLVGITSLRYNKPLRLFETTLVDGTRGPDISLDAIIAKDNTVKSLKDAVVELNAKVNQVNEQYNTTKGKSDELSTLYNKYITDIIKIVDDIEGLVRS